MRPLAVSCGDPSGIGPEIAIAAWAKHRESLPPFYLLCDPDLVAAQARRRGLDIPLFVGSPDQAVGRFSTALPVVRLENPLVDTPGVADAANAAGIVEAIDRAVADALAGRAAGVVTCPIAKKPLYDSGFAFPGHTEYLGHLAEMATGMHATPVMMLAGPDLRAVPVTIHVPLAEVPSRLSASAIVATGRIVAHELNARFGIAKPRIAVAGLNPHAGEDGSMGTEEITIIIPAIRALRSAGVDAFGPLPADTMFHARARAGYDAALCMYHDQALIPTKTLAFDETVNVTLGLPFIRTSPDHGTAFDIAGKGLAREDSFVAALRLAGAMARRTVATAA